MYVIDRELRQLLEQMDFRTESPAVPFDPETQIQACSIDLRLDRVFWRPRSHFDRPFSSRSLRRRVVDLRRVSPLERSRRFYWRRLDLLPSESIVLRPGEYVLGRTCEEFTIPPEYAAKFEGRSSFARLGLSIHFATDFINPGYRGRMPIQLCNFSPRTMRVPPYLPVCQLVLVKLSARPDRTYPEREPHSKYMNDDGGPSVWWKDRLIQDLQSKIRSVQPDVDVQDKILSRIGTREPELIQRFENFLEKLPIGRLSNVEDLLHRFAVAEDKHRRTMWWAKHAIQWLASASVALALGSLFTLPYGVLHYVVWGIAGALVFPGVLAWKYEIGEHFGLQELERVQRD